MKNGIICLCLFLSIIAVSGCRVTDDNHHVVLDMHYSHPPTSYAGWISTSYTTLHYYGVPVSYAEIKYEYEYYYGSHYPSLQDLRWLLWDLGGIDSRTSGWLSLEELRLSINRGHPVWINYGTYDPDRVICCNNWLTHHQSSYKVLFTSCAFCFFVHSIIYFLLILISVHTSLYAFFVGEKRSNDGFIIAF